MTFTKREIAWNVGSLILAAAIVVTVIEVIR